MGFMNWLIKNAGFENDDDDYDRQGAIKAKEEKRKNKDKKQKNKAGDAQQKSASPAQTPASNSYLNNPEQYYSARYDDQMNDYGIGSSNVGGYGSKNVQFVSPTGFEDIRKIINYLRNGESVMLNLNQMGPDSQRVLDCVFGAVCALNGNLERVDNNIFFITPEGYNIKVADGYRGRMN